LSSHNEEIDLDIENKLLSQIEKLKNENGRLKDKIYDFKQTSKKLSKLINQI
jgi:septal ring factor EnvC (AmiA/AmiB activator)